MSFVVNLNFYCEFIVLVILYNNCHIFQMASNAILLSLASVYSLHSCIHIAYVMTDRLLLEVQ